MAESKKGKLNAKKITATLRSLDLPELEKKLAEEQEKLMQDRFRHATANLADTASLKTTRRQIARIETIITERKITATRAAMAADGKNMGSEKVEKSTGLDPTRSEEAKIDVELKEGAQA